MTRLAILIAADDPGPQQSTALSCQVVKRPTLRSIRFLSNILFSTSWLYPALTASC